MKIYKLCLVSIISLATFLTSCSDSDSFDNKTYIQASSPIDNVLIKRGVSTVERSLQTSIAQREDRDISIIFKARTDLTEQYNREYKAEAILLPAEYYEMANPEAIIKAGSVLSSKVQVVFKNLDVLDKEKVYVLPVAIDNVSHVGLLDSKSITYFVVKEAALINTVANVEKNYLTINWKNPDVCNKLTQLTMEALINAKSFDDSNKSFISTVMGIEGQFLIRIGDAGFPTNQIQIATNNGNYPDADSNKGLPTNEWVHIALTYDSQTNSMKVYINGKVQSDITTRAIGPVDLGIGSEKGFCIGYSYDINRYLNGYISECRIWNVVRTQDEIANNPFYVDPASSGLVAYWKFDEGDGSIVKDHTANGNDAQSKNAIKWVSVNLPAKSK